MPEHPEAALRALGVGTGYGRKRVLDDINIAVGEGEIVAVIGHNGAGKSTLLKAVFGLLPIWEGDIWVNGLPILEPNPRKMLALGVAYVPQGNRVFSDLTVSENFDVCACSICTGSDRAERIDRVVSLFPRLKDRLAQSAGTLSGGEKQMLALAMALTGAPRMLLLDEPSLGLAPPLVSDTLQRIQGIADMSGVGLLVVEQKVREVLKIAHRVYVLRNGAVSFAGPAASLTDDAKLREVYL